MKFVKHVLVIAGLGMLSGLAGCGEGGDYIPLAKVEEPKGKGESKSVGKKPANVGGSPTTPVYK